MALFGANSASSFEYPWIGTILAAVSVPEELDACYRDILSEVSYPAWLQL